MRLEVQRTDLSYERVDVTFGTYNGNGKEIQYIFFGYTNEIDLRHPIIDYYARHNNTFDDVIDEIHDRKVTQIVISSSWAVPVDRDMIAKLFDDKFVSLDPLTLRQISQPRVAGYRSNYSNIINDCEAMNAGLDLMLRTYSKKHNFKNIKDFRKDSYVVYPINIRRVD